MSSRRKILLIDYDPESIESTRGPLVKAGYEVDVASDGIAGVEAFRRLNPDLVLIEPMVPKKHGFQVCQEIKSTAAGRDTPVLITTGFYRGSKHRVEAHECYGCDDYLEKPIAEELLLSTCGKFLIDTQEPPIPVADASVVPLSLTPPVPKGPVSDSGPALVDRLPDIPIPGEERESSIPALDDLTEDEIQERLDAMIIGEDSPPVPEPPPAIPIVPPEAVATRTVEPAPPRGLPVVESPSATPSVEAPTVQLPEAAPARSRLPIWIGIAAGVFIIAGMTMLWLLRDQGAGDSSVEVASMSIGEPRQTPARTRTSIPPARIPFEPFAAPEGAVPDAAADLDEAADGIDEGVGEVVAPIDPASPKTTQSVTSQSPSSPRVAAGDNDPVAVASAAATTAAVVSETEVGVDDAIDDGVPAPPTPRAEPVSQPEAKLPEVVTQSSPPAKTDLSPLPVVVPEIEKVSSAPVEPLVPMIRRGDLVDITDLDRVPVARLKPMPDYPPAARSMRLEGMVNLRLLVDDHGKVQQVEVDSGTKNKLLQRTAVNAAEKWVYDPGMKDGVPVKVWVNASVNFKQ